MSEVSNKLMAWMAFSILALDQLTKALIAGHLDYGHEMVIFDGFFKLVYWGNKGAAWSLFHTMESSNRFLTVVSMAALVALFLGRSHFQSNTLPGQVSLGLIFGGIMGNTVDRLMHGHVVDFIYFYLYQRGGGEAGFPAFNVADSAICTGVGLLFIISWRKEQTAAAPESPS